MLFKDRKTYTKTKTKTKKMFQGQFDLANGAASGQALSHGLVAQDFGSNLFFAMQGCTVTGPNRTPYDFQCTHSPTYFNATSCESASSLMWLPFSALIIAHNSPSKSLMDVHKVRACGNGGTLYNLGINVNIGRDDVNICLEGPSAALRRIL